MAKTKDEETKPCGAIKPRDQECILAEDHAGPHQNAAGDFWHDQPEPARPKAE
jgi:hypothetical protein